MAIEVRPLTVRTGAEIRGVQIADLIDDDGAFDEVRKAWLDHGVVFFRDQRLTRDQHVAFGRRLGELHVHPYAPNLGPDHPEIIELVTSEMTSFLDWHADATFEPVPPMASILYAHECPTTGGDTLFTNAAAAHDALSDTLATRIAPLRAVHDSNQVFGSGPNQRGGAFATRWTRSQELAQTQVLHPVVTTHPETGRKVLFVNRQFTTRIDQTTPAESALLLDLLRTHLEHPSFQVRFKWEPGSVAMWDNRTVQHGAVADFAGSGQPRRMHRVTVLGTDRPA